MSDIDDVLAKTLEDHRLSRGEKKALRSVIEDLGAGTAGLAEIRNRAFSLAVEALADSRDADVLGWLKDVVKLVESGMRGSSPDVHSEALFSPNRDCVSRIQGLVGAAASTLEICVYTITDNRVSREVLEAHRRGVAIRIITDDEKSGDSGSDIDEFRRAGIPVVMDASEFQMHHKFAIFDRSTLLTGSYNWTRTAAEHNQENIVITDDPRLVEPFLKEFERLWATFGGSR